MKTQTVFVPVPVSESPKKDGSYCCWVKIYKYRSLLYLEFKDATWIKGGFFNDNYEIIEWLEERQAVVMSPEDFMNQMKSAYSTGAADCDKARPSIAKLMALEEEFDEDLRKEIGA